VGGVFDEVPFSLARVVRRELGQYMRELGTTIARRVNHEDVIMC
jgi:hypothetical protein